MCGCMAWTSGRVRTWAAVEHNVMVGESWSAGAVFLKFLPFAYYGFKKVSLVLGRSPGSCTDEFAREIICIPPYRFQGPGVL